MPELVIVTVYSSEPALADILALQSTFVAQTCSDLDYEILAVPLRISDATTQLLSQNLPLSWLTTGSNTERDKWEHGCLLDLLLVAAMKRRPRWICVMDPDAFPIAHGWFHYLSSRLVGLSAVASVFRRENDDTFLPHPSFMLFAAEVWTQVPFSFSPSKVQLGGSGARHVAYAMQFPDVGIELARYIAESRLNWLSLTRTNRRNEHFLLGGVYGDLVFHLGSLSKNKRLYRGDRSRSSLLRLHYRVRDMLQDVGVRRTRAQACADALTLFERERRIAANNKAHSIIVHSLRTNPAPYLTALRGASPTEGSTGEGVAWHA